jgi:hypothetical protein
MTIWHNKEIVINFQNISQERLDGEVILISFDTGKYFSAIGSGADILWLAEKGVSQKNWETILSATYENFLSNDPEIAIFIQNLVNEGLVLEVEDNLSGVCELPLDIHREGWLPPKLVAFNDLQDLLLIDPIHDTSLEGWPKTKDE